MIYSGTGSFFKISDKDKNNRPGPDSAELYKTPVKDKLRRKLSPYVSFEELTADMEDILEGMDLQKARSGVLWLSIAGGNMRLWFDHNIGFRPHPQAQRTRQAVRPLRLPEQLPRAYYLTSM